MESIASALLKTWANELGFSALGVSDIDLLQAESRLLEWLKLQYHGTMDYMAKHGSKRTRPSELLPGTLRAITVRMDYLPEHPEFEVLEKKELGFVSRYAQHRDYHKLIRKRLQQLADRISQHFGGHHYRVFTDSAPVMEKPLAEKAGLGWIGKNTNLIDSKTGSFFFLGVIYTDLPFEIDAPLKRSHCGSCTACITACPTQAIVGPYQLDARRCISYLTIEHKGSIPVEFRPLMGNRIYGCDDCQIVCPWNKFATAAREIGFHAKRGLLSPRLVDLFAWTEAEFLQKTEGSAIRRIGYEQWLRNIAIALGNAPKTPEIEKALLTRRDDSSALVREHVEWALQHIGRPLAL
ncbi:MAG: tRNA epoxyqueuosine(34) reductase QueG [Proteobacteria bacterium]|nr:tRNA epoxyqueuosine(34) reductase QueG [Pseudomonadota bacterium]